MRYLIILFFLASVSIVTTANAATYGYSECETEQNTTSTTFVDACTLTFTADAANYIIAVAFELGQSNTGGSATANARLNISGTQYGNIVYYGRNDATQRYNMGWVKNLTFSAGSQTIKVQYNNSGGTAYIRGIHILAWKAPTFQYTEAYAPQNFNGTETTLATLTFTPASAQNYLILASFENQGDWSTLYMRLKVDGTVKNSVDWDSVDQNLEYRGHALMLVQNLTAASHTIVLTGQTLSGNTRAARNVRIAAIPLGSLTTYSSSNETTTSTTQTTYQDKLSQTNTTGAGDHIIFASSELNHWAGGVLGGPTTPKYNNLLINGVQYQEAKDCIVDSEAEAAWPSFFAVKKLSLTAGSNTFKIQHSTSSASYAVNTKNARILIIQLADLTPPASITNLANTTGTTWINWTWTNPADTDFNYTMIYINGTWQANTSNPFYNLTGLSAGTTHTIATHTVDTSGNVNQTWVNQTTTTRIPDLIMTQANISFSYAQSQVSETGEVKEGVNVTINATVYNNGTGDASNVNVSFYDGSPSSNNNIANTTIASIASGASQNATVYWNSLVGTHNISVKVDPDNTISESDETNNNASKLINVSAWQKYYGNVSGNLSLRDQPGNYFSNWTWGGQQGNVFITNVSNLNFSNLQALGRNKSGAAAQNNFSRADVLLNLTPGNKNATGFANNNITQLFSTDGTNPMNTTSFTVYGRTITNVPIVNSTNVTNITSVENAAFITGILWDTTKDNGDLEYGDDSEDLVFIAKINAGKTGIVGTAHDYEIAVPSSLKGEGVVYFYVELK